MPLLPVVFELLNGKKATIRHVLETDAFELIQLQLATTSSSLHLLTLPDEVDRDIARRKAYVKRFIKHPDKLYLVVEFEHQLIGQLQLDSGDKFKIAHVAELNISIREGYRGAGIGRKLIELAIQWFFMNENLQQIQLKVHASNQRAIHLYEKMGFVRVGFLPKALKLPNGNFENDCIYLLQKD